MRHSRGGVVVLLLGGATFLTWTLVWTNPWFQQQQPPVPSTAIAKEQMFTARQIDGSTEYPNNDKRLSISTVSVEERLASKPTDSSIGSSTYSEAPTTTTSPAQYYYVGKQFTAGRLGNQLFEWFATMGLAAGLSNSNNNDYTYLPCEIADGKGNFKTDRILSKAFNISVPHCPFNESSIKHGDVSVQGWKRERGFAVYDGDLWLSSVTNATKHVAIGGSSFLQSFRYMDLLSPTDSSLRDLRLTDETEEQVHQMWDKIPSPKANNTIFVGMHIRRTDMLTFGYGAIRTPRLAFLQRATLFFQQRYSNNKHIVFVVASDDPSWCRNESSTFFVDNNNNKNKTLSDIWVLPPTKQGGVHLSLLALHMNGGMVVTAGTFGWWAAYLAQQKSNDPSNYPVVYFGDTFQVQGTPYQGKVKEEDYFPSDWIPLPDTDFNETIVGNETQ